MYRIKTIETGFFLADGGAMFGAVPKRAWSKKYPSQDNLCRLAMRCVLAEGNGRKVLIDTGIGAEDATEFAYYRFSDVKRVDVCLREEGIHPEDITDVILTHLHFDHCGASTGNTAEGQWVATFPKARYWCSSRQWQVATNPGFLEADSFLPRHFLPLWQCGQLQLLDGEMALDEYFKIKIYDGHTAGQLVCHIDGVGRNYLVPGDVIPTACHVSLGWISAYDVNAEASVEAKLQVLCDAVNEQRRLIFFHDAYTPQADVVQRGSIFTAKKV